MTPLDARFDTSVRSIHTRLVAPALQELDETLDELGARPTLLRGWPAIAGGAVGLVAGVAVGAAELAQLACVTAGASVAAVKEAEVRRSVEKARRENRFFFLYEANRQLKHASERHRH